MNKKDVNIIFMGTPSIARDSLKQLIEDGFNVTAVFTREDKPVGRKKIITPPPTKILALEHNIPVYQPKTLKGDMQEVIKDLKPDLIVVVAYGRILPKAVIDTPKLGCINLHVSLLPKYRGAAPIQWALINGDEKTGVTVMQIDEGLDTGDIIDVLPIDISEDETQTELFSKVSEKGKVFLSKTIDKIILGDFTLTKQDDENATLAPPLSKEMAEFDFNINARVLHNKIRALNPWPSTHFNYKDKKIKVLKAKISNLQGTAGEILSTNPLIVACNDFAIELSEVKPEGSKAMTGTAFCAGARLKKGDNLV